MELIGITPLHKGVALSFEELFEAEHDRLYRALCLVTRNRHEAEEIMQDAFLAMWARWDRISTDVGDPTAYLYRTAMNSFRRRHRRAALAARKAVRLIQADNGIRRVAYRLAGADCVFVPDMGTLDKKTIAHLVEEIDAPINVVAGDRMPSLPELEEIGVARVTFGPRPMRATLALIRKMAREWVETGTLRP